MEYRIVDLKTMPYLLPVVAEWHHQQWSHLNPGQLLVDRIAKMQTYLLEVNICTFAPKLFVAVSSDNLPLGTAALDLQDMDIHQELTPWLASVYVQPQYRLRGIASALVKYAVNSASNAGVEKLYLFTPDQKDFYLRRGWKGIQQLKYYGESVDLMVKKLL